MCEDLYGKRQLSFLVTCRQIPKSVLCYPQEFFKITLKLYKKDISLIYRTAESIFSPFFILPQKRSKSTFKRIDRPHNVAIMCKRNWFVGRSVCISEFIRQTKIAWVYCYHNNYIEFTSRLWLSQTLQEDAKTFICATLIMQLCEDWKKREVVRDQTLPTFPPHISLWIIPRAEAWYRDCFKRCWKQGAEFTSQLTIQWGPCHVGASERCSGRS